MATHIPNFNPPDLVERYLSGESIKGLAASYGVSRVTITRRLKRADVVIRGISEANVLHAATLTPEQRRAQAAAAHAAKRGVSNSHEALCRAAVIRQGQGRWITGDEKRLAAMLLDLGIPTTAQQAVGPYNIDIGAEPVAVEVHGGHWHASGAHAIRFPKRCHYLLDAGWSLMIVWVTTYAPLSPLCAEHVAAFIERSRSDPSFRRQYRVIWGDGEVPPASELDLDHPARVPPRIPSDRPRPRDKRGRWEATRVEGRTHDVQHGPRQRSR